MWANMFINKIGKMSKLRYSRLLDATYIQESSLKMGNVLYTAVSDIYFLLNVLGSYQIGAKDNASSHQIVQMNYAIIT